MLPGVPGTPGVPGGPGGKTTGKTNVAISEIVYQLTYVQFLKKTKNLISPIRRIFVQHYGTVGQRLLVV